MKEVRDFVISKVTHLNPENFIIEFSSTDPIPDILPGTFAELRVDNDPDIFLRRPFSILNADHNNNLISFYIKIIGKGTRKLADMQPGQVVNIIFPLGNSFTSVSDANVLIIGGGSGIAPFILLGKKLQKRNNRISFLLGARSEKDIFLVDEFNKYGEVYITTEDGSMGEKGLVTHHSLFENPKVFSQIYTCGPDPMMSAVAKIAQKNQIPCEASLENTMACGFGACLCCVVATTEGNKCVCTEGPVFNVKELKW